MSLFTVKKRSLLRDFTDPAVALVVPLITIDLSTICVGIYSYAHELGHFDGYDYPTHYVGVYWFYFSIAVLTVIPVTFGWFGSVGKTHELSSFSLTGCFLVFPIVSAPLLLTCPRNLATERCLYERADPSTTSTQMLGGTMALAALQRIPASHPQTFAILISGYMMQGIGFGVSACFIMVSQYRAIRYGFHRGASAASGFLACGPFGYTALVLLRLGDLGRNM